MAFDLYAFDLFAAPRDRYDFIDWIRRSFRDMDGAGAPSASLPPALQAWLREMMQSFPAEGASRYSNFDDDGPSKLAAYRFTATAIQASFDWNASGPALYRAKRAAERFGAGLYDASGHEGAVWMISQRGRWEIVHRADDGRRGFA